VPTATGLGGETTSGHDVVNVWMMLQVLSPSMEHAKESDLCSQMLRIAGEFQQCGGTGSEEQIVKQSLVLQSESREFLVTALFRRTPAVLITPSSKGTPLRGQKIGSGEKRVHRDTSIGFSAVNKRARSVVGLWESFGKKLPRAGSVICRGMVLNFTGATLPSSAMITISKEDYLKAIAESEAEGEAVISATLAHWLAVSRPAVTAALKRLKKDGLVTIKNDGRIQLTSQGRRIAEQTILRHHLVERMLSEIFGMPWYEVHEEAERLEHAVSPAFEKKLVEKLGDNDICPHGNSLALKSPLERRKKGQYLLSEAAEGSHYRVASVYERDRKLLDFFEGEGIRPGARLALQSHNYDGTLSLTVDKRTIRLGAPAAEKVWVVKL